MSWLSRSPSCHYSLLDHRNLHCAIQYYIDRHCTWPSMILLLLPFSSAWLDNCLVLDRGVTKPDDSKKLTAGNGSILFPSHLSRLLYHILTPTAFSKSSIFISVLLGVLLPQASASNHFQWQRKKPCSEAGSHTGSYLSSARLHGLAPYLP